MACCKDHMVTVAMPDEALNDPLASRRWPSSSSPARPPRTAPRRSV